MAANATDETLMIAYCNGDPDAFAELYARHRAALYRFIRRQCAGAVADELFQDVWTRLIVARRRYHPSAKFSTYLYQVARNRLIDHFRSSGRHLEEAQGGDPPEAPAASGQQPENAAQTRQQASRLLGLIETLPSAQREAFLLHQEAGLTLAEIGEVTGVGRETVKSRLRYALAILRRGMEGW
ncbi:MAG: sigma-70 family RNA polymerase sigma factor [Betaproteobacteria bacterium]|jgi:RNA polymerase sigma-70 factor (ECF subfamily)|nr:MAG: sigma-70 family RNA polymerase sigma factor [Betaproteobacteria bacterium]